MEKQVISSDEEEKGDGEGEVTEEEQGPTSGKEGDKEQEEEFEVWVYFCGDPTVMHIS